MENIKNAVHRITNHMQAVIGFLELQEYDKALKAARDASKEIRLLAKMLTGFTVPVPPGTVVKIPSDAKVVTTKNNVVEIVPPKKN